MLIAAQALSRQFLEVAGLAEPVLSVGSKARQYRRAATFSAAALIESLLPQDTLILTISCETRGTLDPTLLAWFATGNTSRLDAP